MQIIRKSKLVEVKQYSLVFEWNDDPGSGFSFPCTKDGDILFGEMRPEAMLNFRMCQDGTHEVTMRGVRNESYTYLQPASGLCSNCNSVVELHSFTNTCKCGWEYNPCGQLLAPRAQW